MSSQWERLLKNSGTWVGSFTHLSPLGELLDDTPTVVALKPLNQGNTMRQEIIKSPPASPPQERVLEYQSLAKSVLFFSNGAFSQGSLQWGPFSEFGAELGLIVDNHRLRLVQRFSKNSQLAQLTLIREHLAGTLPSQRPRLSLSNLVGSWHGTAVTLYPDLRPSDTYSTRLDIVRAGDTIQQALYLGQGASPMTSEGQIQGDRIVFASGSQTIQALLMWDGASSVCPTTIEPRRPFFLEVGWLIGPDQRQRMIRQYTAQGSWESLTLVTESRKP